MVSLFVCCVVLCRVDCSPLNFHLILRVSVMHTPGLVGEANYVFFILHLRTYSSPSLPLILPPSLSLALSLSRVCVLVSW